jgi:hypothetical protein
MMAGVKIAPGTRSTALVVLLGALTGAAAWLGVAQSSSGHGANRWVGIVAQTKAAGTLAFTTTQRSSGLSTSGSQPVGAGSGTSVERVSGVVNFTSGDALEVSVVRSASFPAQWMQTLAVAGSAYGRNGIDRRGGARFSGAWFRESGFSLPPLGAVVGVVGPQLAAGPPNLVLLGHSVERGIPTTIYQVSWVRISCPVSEGAEPRTERGRSRIWVDAQGRIRRYESVTVARFGGGTSTIRTTAVTEFGEFGRPVHINPPAAVVGTTPRTPTTLPNPLAGCLVTPA